MLNVPPGAKRPGTEVAFRQTLLDSLDGLYRFALSLSRDATVAEDLVQEAYVRALSAKHKPPPDDNVRGWLFTILHNVWRNELRRAHPEQLDESGVTQTRMAARSDGPDRTVERHEADTHLQRALEALPDAYREVIVLRFIEGFSYREIAEVLGCPAGTVMSRLARAREKLRQALRCWAARSGRGGS